ncbi:MAG: SixA phosphatase family protein [Trichloromonadaceae bacterium]
MKRLTLVRHGKSSWKDPEVADFGRPLNKRGERDAPRMGERLAQRGLRPDLLLSSPAKRTRQTAEALAEKLQLAPEQLRFDGEIYEAEPSGLLEVIRGLEEAWGHVLLVGHNPGLTELGNLLADCGLDNLPTCGLLVIDFDLPSWQQVVPKSGVLTLYDYPKNPQAAAPGKKAKNA